MSKAILVIDMPKSCKDCAINFVDEYSYWCPVEVPENQTDVYSYMEKSEKPVWCPLMPAPEPQLIWYEDESSNWERGYNDCLREIMGDDIDG